MAEELHFLRTLLLHGTEVFLVGSTERCKYTDGRLDDVAERRHLVGLADASLKKAHLRMFVEQPDREGDTNL